MIDGRDSGEAAVVWVVVLTLVAAAILAGLFGQVVAYTAVGFAAVFYGLWWVLG